MEAYTEFAQVYDRFMDNVPYEAWCEGISKNFDRAWYLRGTRTGSGRGTGTMTRLASERL